MYIKSLVLDGFKSYGSRTEIHGFDKEFNAITGLNGTGKSNILDAICFVLGITNLSNVRAASLQDLVYKNGQAGINRASVSITFDNRDKNQCPVGYQDYDEFTITRQVVMGGKNKYMLNGTTVQNKRIQDLFCSVQLNVNNPHFLIMQGRITKVLNMKPPEILSMIEESAGTKMYENKRSFAQKTIEKKDAKLQEIDALINEEIGPKLNKLREERSAYLEFQTLERQLQHMQLKYSAFQYILARKLGQNARSQLTAAEKAITDMHQLVQEAKKRCEQIDSEVHEMQQKDDGTGEKFKELEAVYKEKEKMHTKTKAEVRGAADNLTSEEKKLKQLEKGVVSDEKALVCKRNEMDAANDEYQRLREAERADTEQLTHAQKRLEALHAGMDIDEEGRAATLQEQLMTAREAAHTQDTRSKQHSMQLQFVKQQLGEKKQQMKGTRSDYDQDRTQHDACERELKALQKKLDYIKYDEKASKALHDRRRQFHNETRIIRDRLEQFERRNPLTEFRYTDPEPNWNKNKVHGVVCNLVKLTDPQAARAIETAAGGRLFNVVVDTEATSKKILQRGNLQHRTTIIPLNKISGQAIPQNVVNIAQKLVGKENVRPALALLDYSREVQQAMQYVFGGAFICKDMETASRVAFDDRIKRRCVTLDGDVCDPGGTLSGGAVNDRPSVFTELVKIKEDKKNLQTFEAELQVIERQIHESTEQADKYNSLSRAFELKQHQLRIISDRLASTTHGRLQQEVTALENQLKELEQQLKQAQADAKEAIAKATELEKRVTGAKGGKEKQLKDAEKLVEQLKKKAAASQTQWNKREQEYESKSLEIAELEESIETGHSQIEISKQKIEDFKQKLQEANENCEKVLEEVKQAQANVKELKHLMNSKNKDIQKKLDAKTKLQAEISEIELEIKKQTHVVDELSTKCKDANAAERNLEKHARGDKKILQEAENITDKEGHDLGRRIHNMQEHRNKMARTVNLKAQSMFEQEEKTYTTLMKRKKTIENDKKRFLHLLEDVDKKKSQALTKACDQISKDFGSIFATLLPGAGSRLQPPMGKTVLDGLEIKVSLGGIWRDSLSELSGGQKSLIALSLILAMLLYKPAPLYILDEIDAALDLSHTQNIGNMLHKHFKHSQFIIVSLKEGMFSNANVLYRTRFVDGMSAVQRLVNTNRY